MRIWDITPKHLCREHLLGEHRELHAIWAILTTNKTGYGRHPETLRWKGKLKALYLRHEKLVAEMRRRGYQHRSNLNKRLAVGSCDQSCLINTPAEQRQLLKRKPCSCFR